jgi:wobble nucleotide-excising tRNase
MEHIKSTPVTAEKLLALRRAALERYGEDALFTHYQPSTQTIATLTLEEAIEVCGHHIAGESSESVITTLDRMHKFTQKLATEKPQLLETSIRFGRQILLKYLN